MSGNTDKICFQKIIFLTDFKPLTKLILKNGN
jgi:hypothetical protein